MTFHIVHSVKGGCGKTTFSVGKALIAARVHAETGVEARAKVLYIDCDFKGSSARALFYATDEDEYNKKQLLSESMEWEWINISNIQSKLFFLGKYNPFTLNDYLRGTVSNMSLIKVTGVFGNTEYEVLKELQDNVPIRGEESTRQTSLFVGKIDMIFASSLAGQKTCFQHEGEYQGNKNIPALDVGVFELRMEELLREIRIAKDENGEEQYSDVIIDMPPGTDEYSEVLLKLFQKNLKEDVSYYSVTSCDEGHIFTTAEHLATMLCAGSTYYRNEDSVICVFNGMPSPDFEDATVLSSKKKRIENMLKAKKIDNMPKFILNKFCSEYYKRCRKIVESEDIVFEPVIEEL